MSILNILKEDRRWSFTRIIACIGYIAFLTASIYLIINNQSWGNYETFALYTGGGSAGLQAVNKFINSKYNTPAGQAGKPQ